MQGMDRFPVLMLRHISKYLVFHFIAGLVIDVAARNSSTTPLRAPLHPHFTFTNVSSASLSSK